MEYFGRYKVWVRQNGNVLSLLETGASSLTWLLPDRFSNNELTLEAIHTAINLLSVFHESIVAGPAAGAPPGAAELTLALSALQQVEVLVELWALYNERTGGIGSRYDPLIAVEGLKAVVRFAIFRRSEARILCNGGATAFDPLLLYSQRGAGRNNEARAKEVFEAFAAFREQHCFPPIPAGRQGSNNPPAMDVDANDPVTADGQSSGKKALWWEGPPAPAHPSPPAANLAALKDLEQRAAAAQAAAARLLVGAEVLHILRPLVYVLALRRWGRRSWKPWLLSLVVELASARLTSSGAVASRRAAAEASRDPAVVSTSLAPLYAMQGVAWRRDEADELTRRKLLLLYYLLRDPFFSRFTGPAVERWQGRLGRVPLVGWITDKAAELLLGVQKYYTYTAAS